MVRPSKLDPCFTPPEVVGEHLKSLVIGHGNEIVDFIRKGEVSQGAQLAMSVLKVTNSNLECGKGLSPTVKTMVRNSDSFSTYFLLNKNTRLTMDIL